MVYRDCVVFLFLTSPIKIHSANEPSLSPALIKTCRNYTPPACVRPHTFHRKGFNTAVFPLRERKPHPNPVASPAGAPDQGPSLPYFLSSFLALPSASFFLLSSIKFTSQVFCQQDPRGSITKGVFDLISVMHREIEFQKTTTTTTATCC